MLAGAPDSFEAGFANRDFFRFVREERVFCSVLAHLLNQSGSNLAAFLQRITSDIVYPGRWSVDALNQLRLDKETFRELCKLKWAFNIKPDLVILLSDGEPICIEAKLESREGSYPAAAPEQRIFDDRFGPQQRRVGQFELQRFMFEQLLGAPCQQLVIGRPPDEAASKATERPSSLRAFEQMDVTEPPPFITWREVFDRLDLAGSLYHVRQLIFENDFLGVGAPAKSPARPEEPVEEP